MIPKIEGGGEGGVPCYHEVNTSSPKAEQSFRRAESPKPEKSVELENHLLDRTTPHRRKRLAMQRRRTILLQRGQMLRCAIALVRSQAVLREDRIPLAHHPITFDLGKNRSRRNRSRKRVPM